MVLVYVFKAYKVIVCIIIGIFFDEISTSNYLQISFIFVAQMFVKSFDSRVLTTHEPPKKQFFFIVGC